MREHSVDLRVVRTKEAIRNAVVELMEEKGFDAITVKDITSRAKINRGTFYAHYQDKFDFITQCQEEIMTGIANIVKRNFTEVVNSLEEDAPLFTPLSIAVSVFEYLNEHSKFIKAILGPKGDLSFQIKLKEFMWKTLFEKGTTPHIKEENLLVPRQYLVSYVASAHIGVIQQWLSSGQQESPQEMAQILSQIALNGPLYAAGLKK